MTNVNAFGHVPLLGGFPGADADQHVFTLWLARLELTLQHRFAREEGPCGFFAFLCCAAPRYTTLMHKLHADHEQILTALREMRRDVSLQRSQQQLNADYHALSTFIREHEQLEYDALADALDG